MTTAGACQQEYEGELPAPEEMDAQPFPAGAVTGGVDAIYARLTRDEQDGTQCFHLIRLTSEGEAQVGGGCSTDGVDEVVVDERTWSSREYLGDYAHRDGRLWLRIVSWDSLKEQLVLDESEYISCDAELRSTEDQPANIIVHPYALAAGSVPPATPPCDP